MKQRLFTHTAKALVFSTVLLLVACSTTPEKENNTRRASSQDIIFDRAKSAYLSKDYKTASALFSNLADKGHAEAQYTLGYLYYYGTGVPKNLKQAMHLFNLSAAQGNSNAITALATIQKTVNKNQLQPGTESQPQAPQTAPAPVVDLRKLPATPAPATQQAPTTSVPPAPDNRQRKSAIPQAQTTPPSQQSVPAPAMPATPEIQQHDPEPADDNLTNKVIRSSKEVNSAKWISAQPAGYYTIQLSSSTSLRKTLDFMRRVELDGIYFFRTSTNKVDRFTVIHGSFPEYGMAKAKLSLLKERGYKNVWIRGFRGIQTSVNKL